MVVFGSKSSSAKTKLFEQPLDKLLSPKTIKQLNEAIRRQNSKQSTNTQANGNYQRMNNYYANSNNKLLLNNSNTYGNNSDSDIIRDPDEDERCRLLMLNVLPEPIKRLLAELYARGPGTVGIFRKSPNAKHCKELRQKLETLDGLNSIEQFQVNVIASVFKEWLRSLPDCLLMSRLYPQWIDIAKLIEPLHLDKMRQQQVQQQQRNLATNAGIENVDVELYSQQQITSQQTTTMTSSSNSNDVRMQTMLSMTAFELRERHSECIRIVRQLLDALNETNLILLRAIVCVLWHIAGNAEFNKMCSNNLGVCIGQSLLNDEHQRKQRKSRRSSSLGLSNTLMQSSTHNLHSTSNQLPASSTPSSSSSSSSSALRHFSTSTFAKRHRRSRSQGLLASTLSLTNLSSHLSSSPSAGDTSNQRISCSSITNLKQQVNSNNNLSPNNYLNTNDAQEAAKYVPILVAFMIDNAVDLFGSNIVNLFGPRPPSTDVENEDENLSASELHNKSLQQQQKQSSCLTKSMEVSPASSTTAKNEIGKKNKNDINDNTLPPARNTHISQSMDENMLTTMNYLTVEPKCSLADSQKHSDTGKNLVSSSTSTPKSHANITDELRSTLDRSPDERLIVGANESDFIRRTVGKYQASNSNNLVKQHRRNPSMSFITVQIAHPHTTTTTTTTPKCQTQDYVMMKSSTPTANSAKTNDEATDVNINLSQQQHVPLNLASNGELNKVNKDNNNGNSIVSSSELTEAGTTTSILIVNTPKKPADQHQPHYSPTSDRETSCSSSSGDCVGSGSSGGDVDNGLQSQSVSPSCGSTSSSSGCPLDERCHEDDDHDNDQQQQRPLSATESTTSSSRASSSTSGVHSQSPAFSNESTNDYRCQSGGGGSSSSSGNGVGSGCRGSHRRSLSTSISSPDSSASSSTSNPQSICTSPNADDMDTVDGMVIHHHHNQHHIDFAQQQQLLSKHRLSESQLNVKDNDGILVVADKCNQMSKLVDSDDSHHQFISCINRQMATATATTARIVNRLNLTSKANSERPKSMVNLRGIEDVFAHERTSNLIDNNLNEEHQQKQQQQQHQANQQFASQHNDYANFVAAGGGMGCNEATASKRINHNNNNYTDNQFQSQTLNRYSSRQRQHQQHPVMFNRLPKIPFQYTTSCYGGEAVVYYPSNAHISQQQQKQQLHHHQQQQSYPSMHRGCNRIQSLDRQSGSNRQHMQQQHHQQMPQRSHVMMLRDYYLSLQEQSHRQQHRAQLISNHQRATGGGSASSISHGNYLQRVQQQQQERQYLQSQHSSSQQLVVALNSTAVTRLQHHHNLPSMQSLDLSRPSTLVHRFSSSSASSHDLYPSAPKTNSAYVTVAAAAAANNGGITEGSQQQPASAAIAYQRIRPRLARIRQNQFNGLYVKRASSPHSITTGSASTMGSGNGTGLIVRPLDDRELSSVAAAKVAAGVVSKSACAASLMAVSQSSLSQQSSKVSSTSGSTEHSADDDDESDDCSTEWMESTMV